MPTKPNFLPPIRSRSARPAPKTSRRPSAVIANQSRGVSLVEMMTCLALGTILLGVAVPTLGSSNRQTATAAVQALQSHLTLARQEAIKTGQRVALCKSADGITCTAQGKWSQGWLVFQDDNNNAQIDATERMIQRQMALSHGVQLIANAGVQDLVSYQSDGTAAQPSGAFQAGTFTLCQSSATSSADAHLLILSATGRVRVQTATRPRICADAPEA